MRDVNRYWLLQQRNKKSPVIGHMSNNRASSVIGYRLPFTLGHCELHHIVMTQKQWKLSKTAADRITLQLAISRHPPNDEPGLRSISNWSNAMYRDRDHDRPQHTLFSLAVTVTGFAVFILCVKNLWNRYLRYKENGAARSTAASKSRLPQLLGD